MIENTFLKNINKALLFIPITLCIIGVIFIFSTGYGNSYLYIKQIIWLLIGSGFFYVAIFIEYSLFIKWSGWIYLFCILMLILTIFIGTSIRGSKSWIILGPLSIQPSEFMKIGFILLYTRYLSGIPNNRNIYVSYLFSLGILLPPVILILLQPDLGTTLVYLITYFTMSFIGMRAINLLLYTAYSVTFSAFLIFSYVSYQLLYLPIHENSIPILDLVLNANFFSAIGLLFIIYTLLTLLINFFKPIKWIKGLTIVSISASFSLFFTSIVIKLLAPYQWNRLLIYLDPNIDSQGAGYNVIQSRIAIGSGGIFGKGLLKGSQNRLDFLPEKHTDFIFSVIGEEWGFIGTSLVVALFSWYFYLLLKTILLSKDKDGQLLTTGIFTIFFVHFAINLGMSLGITPATGLPLPFISYGGSSCINFLILAGLAINVYSKRFVHSK